jgi:predicted dithiol-disulfide oxidoreductase (DUF899 family)
MKTLDIPAQHKIATRNEWLEARKVLLAKEREHTHQRDALTRERMALPWVKVDKNYSFDTSRGTRSLGEFFADRTQLLVYHFMFGPSWEAPCPSCAYLMDHVDGALPHLNQRDVSFVAISRAPLARIEAFQKRMGWKFCWVSSANTDFNFDYRVSYSQEQVESGDLEYNFESSTRFPARSFLVTACLRWMRLATYITRTRPMPGVSMPSSERINTSTSSLRAATRRGSVTPWRGFATMTSTTKAAASI